METKWYAVYTKPRWEKKVAQALTNNHIENYCPLNKITKKWSDRMKVVEEPLFTSYVFVKITQRQQTQVRFIDGVLNYVYWLGKPAIIRDDEIETIKDFLKQHKNVRLENVRINVADRVKVIDGPLYELEGNVIAVNTKSVKVVLPSLGCMMVAEIRKENIRVLSHQTCS